MCAAASYWAGIERIYYGATVGDALEYRGFDDAMIFEQLRQPTQSRSLPAGQILRAEAGQDLEAIQAQARQDPVLIGVQLALPG
jgi:tRNA(Arg) A34 adenosine deaminase TadA